MRPHCRRGLDQHATITASLRDLRPSGRGDRSVLVVAVPLGHTDLKVAIIGRRGHTRVGSHLQPTHLHLPDQHLPGSVWRVAQPSSSTGGSRSANPATWARYSPLVRISPSSWPLATVSGAASSRRWCAYSGATGCPLGGSAPYASEHSIYAAFREGSDGQVPQLGARGSRRVGALARACRRPLPRKCTCFRRGRLRQCPFSPRQVCRASPQYGFDR